MKEIAADALSRLLVIDRLEVGPVRLGKRRLEVPYTVTASGRTEMFKFLYVYGEDVFDPSLSADLNLASMLSAQVALNYGLFCREILFHGLFDGHDRRFIQDMAANTAREIYVKKFLEPNPFLTGDAADLPVLQKKSYLQSRIEFSSVENKTDLKSADYPVWRTDPEGYAVLSSGGKDSLLSFGLLKELRKTVHPIFVNESGRHWFTALNAYRYFMETFAETSRIWTNSDRLFSWMLRRLPFIRSDFLSVRSDEYPIRLWTVAVFLFGILPLVKKRGLQRIVIGDEFDTTNRTLHEGITHYDGLYDQSRYFDDRMTRYFLDKKWNLMQFSLLRPLSEILIENILVKRYPDLQRHQVSCHAAHVHNTRVLPCGRCEKCRRIVGMLIALSEDPERCGYTPEQIEFCLKELSLKPVHQEAPGAEHLLHLLKAGGHLPPSSLQGKERPEIMRLRFDPGKSPLNTLPLDIRRRIWSIFAEHAHGAVRTVGKHWEEFPLIPGSAADDPNPFSARMDGMDKEVKSGMKDNYLLGELTWPEAKVRFKEVDVALLPVGSIEQHGPHLPLDTDAFDADYLARRVAENCPFPKPLVLPLVPYGVSYHHEDFAGTMSVSPRTLSRIIYDIGICAARNGIKKLVIINAHGGNVPSLQFAAQMINRDAYIFTCVETGETSDKDIQELSETLNDVHAGEIETSTTMAVRPEAVRRDRMKKFIPRFSSRYLDFSSKRSVEWYARTSKISASGVLGDPTKATREKGEIMWDHMIRHLVEFVEDLKSLTIEEIFQKKY